MAAPAGPRHRTSRLTYRCLAALSLVAVAFLGSGCAMVTVRESSTATAGQASGADLLADRYTVDARESLGVLGLDEPRCRADLPRCIDAVSTGDALPRERQLATAAELWAHAAGLVPPRRAAAARASGHANAEDASAIADRSLDAWLHTARLAHDYLFDTERSPGERAFEQRQVRVQFLYETATREVATLLFARYRADRSAVVGDRVGSLAGWDVHTDVSRLRLDRPDARVEELLPAPSLGFRGIRSNYRRDGLGAAFVAVMAADAADPLGGNAPSRYRPVTVVLTFPGAAGERRAVVEVNDPFVAETVRIRGHAYPLAADFTASYGLWLARSGYARQSLRALFGEEVGLDRPRVIMLQPFDPDRRVVVLLHGLASSPEAWVNLANEVLGDDTLRRDYQLWQVYYPTNLPVAINRRDIAAALQAQYARVDPSGTSRASRDSVLVGHSMGGVIARLLVVDSGNAVWKAMVEDRVRDPERRARVAPQLDGLFRFDALPQAGRAVFLAAPHRGTPRTGSWLGRTVSRFVRLPLTLLQEVDRIVSDLGDDDATGTPMRPSRNSIDALSDRSPFIRAEEDLPIAAGVPYHSIIAQRDPRVPLLQSDDGLVPYASAHLDGAASELVIPAWHSVQETPQAILELRRILRLHAAQR